MAISTEGAGRMAEAALRTNGGSEVILRLPGMAVCDSYAEQLGLATPAFQDLPVGPAAWRKQGVNTVLLVAAAAIAGLVGTPGFSSAESLFESAVGFVLDGVLYRVEGCQTLTAAGVACAYRLTLSRPAWL